MSNKKNDYIRIILLILCFISLLGYLLPLLNIDINALNMFSHSMNLNLLSFFSIFNNANSARSEAHLPNGNLLELMDLSNTTNGLIISIISYLAVFILLIFISIFIFSKKFKKASTIMLSISFILYLYIGFTFSNFSAEIIHLLEDSLGFLGSFLNVSDIMNLTLGMGYLITFIAIGCLLFINIITSIKLPKKQRLKFLNKSMLDSSLADKYS